MSLKKVAASMHVEALKKGKSARTLSRGLRLTLFYRCDDIVLALSRSSVLPSEKEFAQLCPTSCSNVPSCPLTFFSNYDILSYDNEL